MNIKYDQLNALRLKRWRVYKDYPGTGSWLVGEVYAASETSARLMALSKYGRADDEPAHDDAIGPDDQFHVVEV